MNRLCIFEDNKFELLFPLVYNRPVFDLHCGMFSLFDRIKTYYPEIKVDIFCRDYLAEVVGENKNLRVNELDKDSESYLFINGRLLIQSHIPIEGDEEICLNDGMVVYARLKKDNYKDVDANSFLNGSFVENLKQRVKVIESEVLFINYFWDLLKENVAQLKKDFKDHKAQLDKDYERHIKSGTDGYKLCEGVYLVNSDDVFIDVGSKIKPGCVLDAENGPIYIGKNVNISSNCTIEGPVYIGDNSKINAHARILEGSNIRNVCKVGGEITNSIMHDYSNKQHDGFLGHAYLGSWVNLGADTVNSNLKNNYETVDIRINKKTINSNQMFLGMVIGDHSKTAINTTFMTGTIVGFGSNVVTSKYPPKYIPSFSWSIDVGVVPQGFDKVIKTAEIVMNRRNVKLTNAEKLIYKKVYSMTEFERSK